MFCNTTRTLLAALSALALFAALPLSGCASDGFFEQAGEELDEAAEETSEALEDAADGHDSALEDAGEELDDAVDELG